MYACAFTALLPFKYWRSSAAILIKPNWNWTDFELKAGMLYCFTSFFFLSFFLFFCGVSCLLSYRVNTLHARLAELVDNNKIITALLFVISSCCKLLQKKPKQRSSNFVTINIHPHFFSWPFSARSKIRKDYTTGQDFESSIACVFTILRSYLEFSCSLQSNFWL